jgi:ribosome-associated heat shock protein Hsp15
LTSQIIELAKAVDIYRSNDTPAEAYQHLELLNLSKEHYRKNGTGRPTKKKDRRDIDEFGNEIKTEEDNF